MTRQLSERILEQGSRSTKIKGSRQIQPYRSSPDVFQKMNEYLEQSEKYAPMAKRSRDMAIN
jgi:hypothetical protein